MSTPTLSLSTPPAASAAPVAPAAATPSTPPQGSARDEQTCELLARAAHATGVERDMLVEQAIRLNMPLARDLSSRYRGRGLVADDLEQVAYLGLVKAVKRFDPERGSGFTGFAVPTVRGEIRRHFRDAGWVVRPPRRIQELQSRIWGAEAELCQQLMRSPRPSEIAGHLGVATEEVVEALATDGCFVPGSLDVPLHDDGGGVMSDRLGGDDPAFDRSEARLVLGEAVKTLSPRDRKILDLRFFQGWTQQAIGAELGVTQMQVSRLLTRILRDLRLTIDTEPAAARAA